MTGFAQSQMSRNKTDKADAKLLAEFAQRPELSNGTARRSPDRQISALVDRLQALTDRRQQELNRLEALDQGVPSNVTGRVEAHVTWLNAQIKTIQSEIDDHIDGDPELKHDAELMRSIPGIGQRSCAQFLAYIGNVRRFKSAKALAAFVGVTPRHRQSGTSINGRTVISRAGHRAARQSLYMPGMGAKRHNPVIIAMAKRLEQQGLAPKTIVGASMRRLVHMIYGVIQSGHPFQANISMVGLDTQEGI